MSQDWRSPFQQTGWHRVLNTEAVEIPAFGVMEITSITFSTTYPGEPIYNVVQPNGDGLHETMINGETPILANGYGHGTTTGPALALYTTGSPAVGEIWGSDDATYTLQTGAPGWLVLGGDDGEKVMVVRAGAGATIWMRTQEAWRTNSGDPRVACKVLTGAGKRTGSTTTGSNIWVYLPRTAEQDPNVVSGENLLCVFDGDGELTPVSDGYLDDKILTVKMWVGTQATIPQGWALMDGTANAPGNGGSGYSLDVSGERGFARYTNIDPGGGTGAVGTTGGDFTVQIDPHTSIVTNDGGSHTHSLTIASDGTHSHPGSTADSDKHSHTFSISSSGAHTHTTDEDTHNHAILSSGTHNHTIVDPGHKHSGGSATGNTDYAQASIDHDPHSHSMTNTTNCDDSTGTAPCWTGDETDTHDDGTLTEDAPGHRHAFSGITVTVGSNTTGITVKAAEGAHAHTTEDDKHSHSIPSSGAHTHSGTTDEDAHTHTLTIASDGSHNHGGSSVTAVGHHTHTIDDLTHNPEEVIPIHLNVMFIERLDNSAGA